MPASTRTRARSASCRATGMSGIDVISFRGMIQAAGCPQIRRRKSERGQGGIQSGSVEMTELTVSRRGLLRSAGVVAAAAALGIKPENLLAADDGVLKVRMVGDIQILDPGYMIGEAEESVLYGCMPRLADPIQDAGGTWAWKPSEYVEKIAQDDETHISFTLKSGLMWSNDLGELTAEDVKYSFERMLKSDWSARWPTLDHVEVKDKYSGVIVLKSPFAGTWLMGIASDSGSILPKVAMKKLKDEKFTTQLPGSLGPYMLA